MLGDDMPTPRKKQDDAIPKHSHCPYCGISIGVDEQFCTKECEEKFEAATRKRRTYLLLSMIPIAVVVIIVILQFLLK